MNILFVTCVWTICCKRAKWSKNLKRSSNQVFCCTPENSQCSCSSKRKKPLPKRHFWMLHIKHGANLRQVYCLYHIKMMLFPSVEAEKLPHFLQWWEIRIIPTVFCWESFSVSRFCKKSCICWEPDMFKIFEHRMKEWDQQPFSFILQNWGFHHQQWFLLFRTSGVGWESGILSLESPVSNWTFKSVETFWRFTKGSGSNPFYICCENGCFLKWWCLQNTPKWSF